MHLKCRNVNTAFAALVLGIQDNEWPTVSEDSRNGRVLRFQEPVLVTYTHPRERVLFNLVRDANPFLHLYEAMWMLAGRNDVAPLAYYAKQFAEYSDDGRTLNGAYGHRWRKAACDAGLSTHVEYAEVDQLDLLVAHLKADPTSRRAVLQMWNVEDDLLKVGPAGTCNCGADRSGPSAEAHGLRCPARQPSRDICCNLSVMFSLREVEFNVRHGIDRGRPMKVSNTTDYLDMTVTNRSNDLVWGMLGANYVHFTFLQEYLAARMGAEVGLYHHFSNNLHAYVDRKDWNPTGWLGYYGSDDEVEYVPAYRTVPLVSDPETFERELPEFVERHKDGTKDVGEYSEPFLRDVAQPMMMTFQCYKDKEWRYARMGCDQVAADDWRAAATNWVKKREGRVTK